jgi:photosystem II stability/assembly factor-like uncharacterized protein
VIGKKIDENIGSKVENPFNDVSTDYWALKDILSASTAYSYRADDEGREVVIYNINPSSIVFKPVELPSANSNATSLGLPRHVAFASKDIVLAAQNNSNFIDGGTLYRSEDGGSNWTKIEDGLANINGISFADENIGYAVGGRTLSGSSQYVGKTTDGGKTWTDLKGNLSRDVNEVWAGISRNTPISSVIAPDSQTVYVTGRHTVYGSFDGGNSWRLVAGKKSRDIDTESYLHSNTLGQVGSISYIATYDGFEYYDSENSIGEEWIKKSAPWDEKNGSRPLSLEFSDSNTGWALIKDTVEGKLKLYKTENMGSSWNIVSEIMESDRTTEFPRGANIKSYGGILFGVNGYNVTVSTDGGASWTKNAWYGTNGWPLYFKVVEGELRVYRNIHGAYGIGSYGVYK